MQYKGDDSPLTAADTESNRVICEGLQRVTPHVPIISEETKALAYDIRKAGPVTALLRCVLLCVCVCARIARMEFACSSNTHHRCLSSPWV